ncbi:intraflagellar transport protein 43 homolog [Copidosoma floridanum]|uniref:intraflagellar transport protein 43 homolog n=1 Tax=Copidosoma floridanum TaxID=29053 RepID=UPI0006C9C777|nr:intraflagellar transport protein 43 homolog [Copidosoma floridanum]
MEDWDDLDVRSKQLIPKLGRRAGHGNVTHVEKSEDEALDGPETATSRRQSIKAPAPPVPPRSRKTGWGDDLKSAKHRSISTIEQERLLNNKKNSKEDDIPIIPDLDEIIDDTNALEISKVPSVGVNRAAAAYEELDTDLVRNKKFSTFEGVNLSPLLDNLYSEHLVRETDEVWSWESLFNQVVSEINTECGVKDDESH